MYYVVHHFCSIFLLSVICICPLYIFNIIFNILPSVRRSYKWSLFFRCSHQNPLVYLLSPIPHRSHPSRFDRFNNGKDLNTSIIFGLFNLTVVIAINSSWSDSQPVLGIVFKTFFTLFHLCVCPRCNLLGFDMSFGDVQVRNVWYLPLYLWAPVVARRISGRYSTLSTCFQACCGYCSHTVFQASFHLKVSDFWVITQRRLV
jgi:hypothetical protein